MLEGGYIDFDQHEKAKPESASKLMKTIEMLNLKIEQQATEKEKLIKKIEALKRNYEGLSNWTKSEKSDYLRYSFYIQFSLRIPTLQLCCYQFPLD